MIVLVVVSSAELASDLTVGVDFVSEFPASGALDEVDLLSPLRDSAGSVEYDEGVGSECLDFGFVRVGNGEGDVRLLGVGVRLTSSAGPVWSFDEGGVSEEGVGCSEFLLDVQFCDWYKRAMWHSGVLIDHSVV